MPAAVFMGLRDVAVEDRPLPPMTPTDVLLEVSHCGICGSDLHFLLEWGGEAGAIEGHEFTGTVVAVGADVTGWSVGDRVVAGPSVRVRRRASTASRAGRRSAPTGAGSAPTTATGRARSRATRRSRRRSCCASPTTSSLKHAALTEPLAVALHGITRGGGARPGTRWLVTGGGPIGFLSVAALQGARRRRHRRERAARERAARCASSSARARSHPDELAAPAMPHDLVDEPFDVALECSGNGQAMEAALAQLKRGGHARARRRGHRARRSSTPTASC